MRLRYIGNRPTTFAHPGVAGVEPGDVFDLDDADAAGFLARADIEEVADDAPDGEPAGEPAEEEPRTRTRIRKTPAPAPAGDETAAESST